jgi:hypothetical protein
MGASQAEGVAVHQGGEIPLGLPLSPFEAEEREPPVAPPDELFDWMPHEDRPSPQTHDLVFAARPAARKLVALLYRAPVRLINGDSSESDGENCNVQMRPRRRKWIPWIWGLSTAAHWLRSARLVPLLGLILQ